MGKEEVSGGGGGGGRSRKPKSGAEIQCNCHGANCLDTISKEINIV